MARRRDHLEILRSAARFRIGIGERRSEAGPLHRRLGDSVDRRRALHAEDIEYGGNHVDHVGELRADLTLRLDALGPVDDQGYGNAAASRLALPATKGRVSGPGPATDNGRERIRPPPIVDRRRRHLERDRHIVEEHHLVGNAVLASLDDWRRCRTPARSTCCRVRQVPRVLRPGGPPGRRRRPQNQRALPSAARTLGVARD